MKAIKKILIILLVIIISYQCFALIEPHKKMQSNHVINIIEAEEGNCTKEKIVKKLKGDHALMFLPDDIEFVPEYLQIDINEKCNEITITFDPDFLYNLLASSNVDKERINLIMVRVLEQLGA